jgi:hypothetical protein
MIPRTPQTARDVDVEAFNIHLKEVAGALPEKPPAPDNRVAELEWIVKLTSSYLDRYGLANTSGERLRDLRGEIAAIRAGREAGA